MSVTRPRGLVALVGSLTQLSSDEQAPDLRKGQLLVSPALSPSGELVRGQHHGRRVRIVLAVHGPRMYRADPRCASIDFTISRRRGGRRRPADKPVVLLRPPSRARGGAQPNGNTTGSSGTVIDKMIASIGKPSFQKSANR